MSSKHWRSSHTLFLMMMVAAAIVVMAGGVAINHGSGEIARNDLVDRHSGRSAMQGDAQLVEQLDSATTNAATDDIGATLGSEETRHGAMLVLRGLFDNGFGDFTVFNSDKSHLRGLAEMRPKLAVGSGNGYFLVLHDDMMLIPGAKIGKKYHDSCFGRQIALDYPIGTANFKTKFLPMLNTP